MKNIVAAFLGIVLACHLNAQNYYRIGGEFIIKSKSENAAQLVMGNFYFDKNEKKIVHQNYFPEKITWVTSDTNLYKIVNNTIVSRQTIPNFSDFSIYNMVLNNKLDNFGLDGTLFKLDKVEQEKDMVISTWLPRKKLEKAAGKIMISSKDNNIFGIVFFNAEGEIIKKQFFEDYGVYSGLAFPGKIVEITIIDGKEVYQVTTYKNIVVNETAHDALYRFDPSGYRLNLN